MQIFSKEALIIGMIMLGAALWPLRAIADHLDNTLQTNVNEQTDLFEESTGNWQEWQQQINSGKDAALDGIRGGVEKPPVGLEFISKQNALQLQNEVQHLSKVKAIDLNEQGSRKLSEENMLEDLYIDYSKPLNKKHKQDAKILATAQDGLLKDFSSLFGKLENIGINCKSVKGDKRLEPTYYLQMQEEKVKNTIYNQTICEELRNEYNCQDKLTLECIKKGMLWQDWQEGEYVIDGLWIHNNQRGWLSERCIGGSKRISKRKYALDFINSPAVREAIYEHSLRRLGKNRDELHPKINIEVLGGYVEYDRRHQVTSGVLVKYKSRTGQEICQEWQEDWSEICALK